jgi:hypothetical protein
MMTHNKTDKRTQRSTKNNLIVSDNVIKNNKFNEMLDILTCAFIYEPTNISTDIITNSYTYINGAPPDNQLHPYLTKFIYVPTTPVQEVQDEESTATEVVDCSVCIGTTNGSHLVLDAEGICCCNSCGTVICLQCACQKQIGENIYCYNCFLPEVSIEHAQIQDTLNPTQLRWELRKFGIHILATEEEAEELGEIYDAVQGEAMYDETTLEGVGIPVKKGAYLRILEKESLLSSFDFMDGGQFEFRK